MKLRPKPAGLLVGLAGLAAFGWGLFNMMQFGSCSTPPSDGLPPCPPGTGWYFLALFLGIFVAIGGLLAGGGAIMFAGIFATVGIASIAAGLSDEGAENRGFLFPFGGVFLLTPFFPLLLAPFALRKARQAQRLIEQGREAIGVVKTVHDTNVTVNNNPRVRLDFRIEPTDGSPAYDATKTVTVSRVEIPRPGDRYPVWFDPANPQTFAFGTDMTGAAAPKVKRLFELAGKATAPTIPAPPALADGDGAAAAEDPIEKLSRLNDLRMKGALTDEEFAVQKAKLLDSMV